MISYNDQTVRVWDAATGEELLILKGHTGGVFGVAFSPDGQRLASSGFDYTVKVWDATTGQEWLTLKSHTSVVLSVGFSPNGQRMASASHDQTVKVWDVRRESLDAAIAWKLTNHRATARERCAQGPWPADQAGRTRAVQEALAAAGEALTVADLAKQFQRARQSTVEEILGALVSLGLAHRLRGGKYTA